MPLDLPGPKAHTEAGGCIYLSSLCIPWKFLSPPTAGTTRLSVPSRCISVFCCGEQTRYAPVVHCTDYMTLYMNSEKRWEFPDYCSSNNYCMILCWWSGKENGSPLAHVWQWLVDKCSITQALAPVVISLSPTGLAAKWQQPPSLPPSLPIPPPIHSILHSRPLYLP